MALGSAALLGACGDDAEAVPDTTRGVFTECETVSTSKATATATVDVQLAEWSIAAPATLPSGAVAFRTTNIGKEWHELVIVAAPNASSLPREKDGTMAEDRLDDGALIGEIEEFPATESCTATFDLAPGRYVLLCNVTEVVGGKTVAHAAKGMTRDVVVS